MTHVGVTGPIDAQVHQRLVAELWRRDRRARRWLLQRLQRWRST